MLDARVTELVYPPTPVVSPRPLAPSPRAPSPSSTLCRRYQIVRPTPTARRPLRARSPSLPLASARLPLEHYNL